MTETAGRTVLEVGLDAQGVTAGVSKVKTEMRGMADAAVEANTKSANSIDRYIKRLEVQNALIGKSAQEAELYKLKLKGASDQQLAAAESLLKFGEAQRRAQAATSGHSISLAQQSAALRGIPAQFTDIVTSLQGGQKPLTVFLQQGGQLKDMFGGAGNAARAMGGYVMGLVNPFTLAAGAAGVLGYAAYQGAKEADAYTRALILTGTAAGVTVAQLQGMASAISSNSKFTQGAAAGALAAFAADGNVSSRNLEKFAGVALKLEREAGIAVADTVKQFAELGKDPVGASDKLNESTRFLTLSVYSQIRALSDQGKTADAAKLAQEAYANAMLARTGELEANLGILEKSWRGIADSAKWAWDKMLGLGREDSVEDKIKSLQARIEAAQNKRFTGASQSSIDAEVSGLQEQIRLLPKAEALKQNIASEAAKEAKQVQAKIKWDIEGEQYLKNSERLHKEITKQRELGIAAGMKEKDIAQRISDVTRKIMGSGYEDGLNKAKLDADLSLIKTNLDQEVNAELNANKLMQAAHAARFISDQEALDFKLRNLQRIAQAEDNALIDQIARVSIETYTGDDALKKKEAQATKIRELEEQLTKLRTNTATAVALHSVEVAAANQKIKQGYDDARRAAENYLNTISRQSARDVSGIGKGTEQRKRDNDLGAIDERRIAKADDLDKQLANKSITGEQYATYLQIVEEAYTREVELYNSRTDQILEANSRWENGFTEAFANYLTESRNVAGNSAALFKNAFDGITNGVSDAFAQALVSGKSLEQGLASVFTSVATQAISSFIKMQIQSFITDKAMLASKTTNAVAGAEISMAAKATETTTNVGLSAVEAAANAFKAMAGIPFVGPVLAVGASLAAMSFVMGLLGGGKGGGGGSSTTTTINRNPYPTNTAVPTISGSRALGGSVSAGNMYEVNERGPEVLAVGGRSYLMMGARGGYVTPNAASSGAAQPTAAQSFDSASPVEIKVHAMPGAYAKDFFMIHRDELGKALVSGRKDNVRGFA